ncbi:MAG TPA: patatin-like phospholipase family protein, partial [Solirubrobacter sp.]|nr:patatin-like phospholipase family protein [Solirubrobacter sp.]
ETGSRADARDDPHRVALVLEGGGMRGVVSAGMVAALERLGLVSCFDLVVGSSAGAINGAAFLAGAGVRAADAYCGPLASRSFVNPLRALRGKPVIDVNDVLDVVTGVNVSGRERLATGGELLHCIAVDVDSARAVDLSGMETERDVWDAILASSRMPWAGGPPVEIAGRRYLDGGMASPVPVQEALDAGATHVLALQTRPFGIPRRSASRAADWLIERHLRGLNPALVDLYRARIDAYERLVDDLERRSRDVSGGPPHVLGLRPPAGTPCVGQLERKPEVLTRGAADGERLVMDALGAAVSRVA